MLPTKAAQLANSELLVFNLRWEHSSPSSLLVMAEIFMGGSNGTVVVAPLPRWQIHPVVTLANTLGSAWTTATFTLTNTYEVVLEQGEGHHGVILFYCAPQGATRVSSLSGSRLALVQVVVVLVDQHV